MSLKASMCQMLHDISIYECLEARGQHLFNGFLQPTFVLPFDLLHITLMERLSPDTEYDSPEIPVKLNQHIPRLVEAWFPS